MLVGSVASRPRTIEPWKGTPLSVPYQSPMTTTAMPLLTIMSTGLPKMGERPRSFGWSTLVTSNTMSPRYEFR